ncbi:MAG: OmpA family protein [Deltaproteobacteria bacterium]|nr:MAG: OmpA family protein [Deltaproteobacteria bacterium]
MLRSNPLRLRRAVGLTLTTAVLLAVASGCVTRSRYEEMKRERDIFASQSETLTLETEALADVAAGLEEELNLRDQEIAKLEATQADLEAELDTLIVAGLVRIKLMRDGLHVVLSHEILFPTASAELSEQGRAVLTSVADDFQDFPYQIAVLGHTDNVPVGRRLAERFPSNWELAAARSASVVRLLEDAGIPPDQLAVVSFGANRPYASNETPEGRAQNRRIEIRLRPVTPR